MLRSKLRKMTIGSFGIAEDVSEKDRPRKSFGNLLKPSSKRL